MPGRAEDVVKLGVQDVERLLLGVHPEQQRPAQTLDHADQMPGGMGRSAPAVLRPSMASVSSGTAKGREIGLSVSRQLRGRLVHAPASDQRGPQPGACAAVGIQRQ